MSLCERTRRDEERSARWEKEEDRNLGDKLGKPKSGEGEINGSVVSELEVELGRVLSGVGQSTDELVDVERAEDGSEVVRESVAEGVVHKEVCKRKES